MAATVAPVQVSEVLAKSLALVPVGVTEVICRLTAPLFVTVMVCGALVVDTV